MRVKIWICAGALAASSAALAQPTDREFILEAGAAEMAQTDLGKLAAKRATDPDVKAYGRRMVENHRLVNQQLKQLAAKKKMLMPGTVTTQQKETYDWLAKVPGPEFDRQFMDTMVQDHTKAIALFKIMANKGQDPDVRQWAQKTLPTLEAHQQEAVETDSKFR